MKLIFLDVDGVLNTTSNWGIKLVNGVWEGGTIEPAKVSAINQIVDATGAKIVVSSMWRVGRTVEDLQKLLNDEGAEFEIIGTTPEAPRERWGQILKWLQSHSGALNSHYVIIDDWLEAGWGHSGHFVNTDPEVGITDADVQKAIEILNA